MKTIWKFPLELEIKAQRILMPHDSKILHVGQQGGVPALWAEVSSEVSDCPRSFLLVGTGHAVPEGVQYVGSVCCNPEAGPAIPGVTAFVWHVYEEVAR